MGYKAAVRILKQAEDLKLKVSRKCDLLNSNEAWTDQQKLQTIYHQALVLDLEYALDKKVEQDLWNIGFKNHISSLQELIRDKKNPKRSDSQALLTWSLEAASGFYLTLLQDLCTTFDVDLSFRRKGSVYGQTTVNCENVTLPQTSSCLYICQYCLVHLGDIARYRYQRKQAENFYKQAIQVSPTSGQPYNQLALLEASQGDKLSTVYYYIRGIAVKNPFPASSTNLMNTLSSAIDKESSVEKIQTKMTVNEFIQLFLCTHGFLHSATDLKKADIGVKSLNTTMTALVATQSFTKDALIKITIINLYSLYHILGSSKINTEGLTTDEKTVIELTLELIAGSLSAFLVPIHTLKLDETLLDYYALPAVKFLMTFIRNDPDVLKNKVFGNRLQIWPSLCKLLNNIQKLLKALNYNKYLKTPLPEDQGLHGFIPFTENFKNFDFQDNIEDIKIEKLIRMKRIVEFSMWLTEFDVNGNKLIIKNELNGELNFEPGCIQPDPTNELLEEMKSFTIIEISDLHKKSGTERKAGILKPQGSLEKSREERDLLSNDSNISSSSLDSLGLKPDNLKLKRSKQNVAIQSIFKKMEENKQVKFSVDEPENEKSVKFDTKPTHQQPPPINPQFNLTLRTQSFNQNHPVFPLNPNPQSDFLTNLRNVPLEKNTNFNFQKTDIPNVNNQIMPPYHNMQHNQTNNVNLNLNMKNKQVGYQMPQQNTFNNQMPPFQNTPYPPSSSFNTWKREEPPQNAPTWWQNKPPPSTNFPRHENFPVNYPYSSNLPSYVGPNSIVPKPDFSKPPPPTGHNHGAGDIFSSQVWGGPLPRNNFMNENPVNFDSNSSSMSMRQAMLKEVTMPGTATGPIGRMSNQPPPEKYMPPTTQGYSLFNTNPWNHNIPGQLRNSKLTTESNINHLPQQSLFTNQGPQSLAQLLEQQNQIHKNDL